MIYNYVESFKNVQDSVWRRDQGKCVRCGSQEKLEFDRIIPFSKGGSNTYRNVQLLCKSCNKLKSNKIG
jgi:5-methylcytosine-specific restriction endonuclease McrA